MPAVFQKIEFGKRRYMKQELSCFIFRKGDDMKTIQEYDTALEKAVKEYIARKDRTSHPCGAFDKASRWEPASMEHCECCDYIRTPSRAYPFSLMTHCRTLEHIAHLYKVDKSDLRKAVRAA